MQTNQPNATLVRAGFTEQDTWRAALGNAAPLRPFALLGESIDAPDVMPAGGMRATALQPMPLVTFRA